MKREFTKVLRILLFLMPLLLTGVMINGQVLYNYQLKGTLSRSEMVERYGSFIQYGVRMYKLQYITTGVDGMVDTASGLLIIPDLEDGIFPMLCYQHGTVSSRDDVPSNLRGGYQIGEVFGGMGFYSVAPDFLGLGDSRGFHPYVHAATEASAGIDMLLAAREFAVERDIQLNDQLFITGYSQGGHAAAALHREIQQNYGSQFTVTASAPMSGPYSISGEMKQVILQDSAYLYPSYLPHTILSYQTMYGLFDDLGQVFREPYKSLVDSFYQERMDLGQLNDTLITLLTDEFGGSFPKKMLQDSIIENVENIEDHPFNRALADNDVYDWAPQAPTRLLYCRADDQVSYRNSIVADSVMNLNGAPDLRAVDVNSSADHVQCVEPAVTLGIFFFQAYQEIGLTSVDPQVVARIRLYPNPARDHLVLENLPGEAVAEVRNLQGSLLQRSLLREGSNTLQLGAMSPGMYLLHIVGEGYRRSEKLVVQP